MIGAKAGDELRIETDAGLRICRINGVQPDGGYSVEVTTGMGIPSAARKTVIAGRRPCCRGHRGLHGQSAFCDRLSITRIFQSPGMRGRRLARKSALTPIFRTRPTSSLCAS